MLNRSRKVACPECNEANFWKGDPKSEDVLSCRACQAEITTYADYIESTIRKEAERMLAEFTEADTAHDLAYLKEMLARPEQRARL